MIIALDKNRIVIKIVSKQEERHAETTYRIDNNSYSLVQLCKEKHGMEPEERAAAGMGSPVGWQSFGFGCV
jgi:hypothetical protein